MELPEEHTKDRDERTLAVPDVVARDIVALWQPGMEIDTCLLAHNHRRSFRNAARRIGYSKTITLRDMRHTFATLSLHHGGDLKATQEALGHTELQSTQRYLSSTQQRTISAGLAAAQAILTHTPPTPPPRSETASISKETDEGDKSGIGVRGLEPPASCSRMSRY